MKSSESVSKFRMWSKMAEKHSCKGKLFILAAPSGGGKSVICRAIMESDSDVAYSVSVTTRPPRPNEVEGRDYYFVSDEQFDEMIENNLFYEWAIVHNFRYGTRKNIVQEILDDGKDVILDLDVQGALDVKKKTSEAVIVFILAQSLEVLRERLRGRKSDDEKAIDLRLENAVAEIESAKDFDYCIMNVDLDRSIERVKAIIEAERHRVGGRHFSVSESGEIVVC